MNILHIGINIATSVNLLLNDLNQWRLCVEGYRIILLNSRFCKVCKLKTRVDILYSILHMDERKQRNKFERNIILTRNEYDETVKQLIMQVFESWSPYYIYGKFDDLYHLKSKYGHEYSHNQIISCYDHVRKFNSNTPKDVIFHEFWTQRVMCGKLKMERINVDAGYIKWSYTVEVDSKTYERLQDHAKKLTQFWIVQDEVLHYIDATGKQVHIQQSFE